MAVSDQSQSAFLQALVTALESAGIDCMLCGSLGSSFYGRPRATNDIDLVIAATQAQLDDFLSELSDHFYADGDAAAEALVTEGSFNVIQPDTGWKADLIIRKGRPFSREEFARRRQADVLGVRVHILSAEDAILSKLEWAYKGGSERQYGDAVGVALMQRPNLDRDYLAKWARELGVEDLLARLLAHVDDAG